MKREVDVKEYDWTVWADIPPCATVSILVNGKEVMTSICYGGGKMGVLDPKSDFLRVLIDVCTQGMKDDLAQKKD